MRIADEDSAESGRRRADTEAGVPFGRPGVVKAGWAGFGQTSSLALLLALAVVASVVRHGPVAWASLQRWRAELATAEGDEIRFKLRPWLRRDFEAARALRPILGSEPVVIAGHGPFFIAYGISPHRCFRVRAIPRFEAQNLSFHRVVRVADPEPGDPGFRVVPASKGKEPGDGLEAAIESVGPEP